MNIGGPALYLVDLSSGSFSRTASQLFEQEALTRKTAAAISSVLSIAEYIHNQPEICDKSKAGLHHLKLDLVSALSWRTVHDVMLMGHTIVLENLSRTIPQIDEDEKVALLHASFKGSTLSGGELAKLQKVNTEHASALTVFPVPAPRSHYIP